MIFSESNFHLPPYQNASKSHYTITKDNQNAVAFLKISDKYESGIFTEKSFAEVTQRNLGECFYRDEKCHELFG